jgi:hypothetical protein
MGENNSTVKGGTYRVVGDVEGGGGGNMAQRDYFHMIPDIISANLSRRLKTH